MRRLFLALALLSCGGGCGGETVGEAAPSADSGTQVEDTGVPPVVEEDSAPPVVEDAPLADAPAWSPDRVDVALPCSDGKDDVYRTPSLSGGSTTAPGDILRCANDATLDLAATQSRLAGTDVDATTGVRQLRIAYRTQRSNGDKAASSARVYLPLIPRSGPLPVVVIGHPSEGIADSCAPSRRDDTMKEIALPFAARGYAVIAPDLPGLGNEGTQAYLDNREQAYALLDGARALRKLLKDGAFGSTVVMAGYSQGGGAVLAAQSLASTYGAGGDLAAVIAIAAQYPTRIESFGFRDLLESPEALTIAHGYSKPVVALLRTYGWFANTGREPAGGIPSAKRSTLAGSIESLCLIPLGGAMQAQAPKVKDFIDDELRQGLLACIASTTDSKCTGTAREYHAFLTQNHLVSDAKGAKILYVQGLLDTVMPAAEEAACNVKKLRAESAPVTVCTDSGATHANAPQRNIKSAMAWLEATLAGTAPASCTDALPTCK
jgi:pimeloyl-ACP methyl ester carboxylesterase